MSVLTKTRHTKKQVPHDLEIAWDSETYIFTDVPKSKVKHLIGELEDYRGDKEDSISWRESALIKKAFKSIGGEPAYRESAYMVRACRRGESMTQTELAALLNIDQGNLSHIEHAERPVGKTLATKLSRIFNRSYKIFLSDLPTR